MADEVRVAMEGLFAARRARGFAVADCMAAPATTAELAVVEQEVGPVPPDLRALWAVGNGSHGPYDRRYLFGVYALLGTEGALSSFSDPSLEWSTAWADFYEFQPRLVDAGRLIPVFTNDHWFLCLRMDDLDRRTLVMIVNDPVEPEEAAVDTGLSVVDYIELCTDLLDRGLLHRVGPAITFIERPPQLWPGLDPRLVGWVSWGP